MSKRERYNSERYAARRQKFIAEMGGKCVRCGATEDLEFDHVDPHDVRFRIPARLDTGSDEVIREELKKCQLLCQKHHDEKTAAERGYRPTEGRHGTVSTYQNCRCVVCCRANTEYMRRYRHKNRIGVSDGSPNRL